MNMSDTTASDRLARRPGQQGARPSAVDQAGVEKLASGSRQSKRFRSSSDETNPCSNHQSLTSTWPKFLVVTGRDEEFSRLSAITICRTIKEYIGLVENTRRLRSSSLLVQVAHKEQSTKLLELRDFAGAPVKVEPHRFFNSCKGVITSHESSRCSDDELRDWLNEYNVIHIYRKPNKQNPQLITLTFDGSILPARVSIGFEWCRVRPYIPNPKRCYNCQRFGHFSGSCRSKAACANCGSREHTHSRDSPCKEIPHCINCGGDEPAYHRGCPKWQIEKEILKIKATKDISFPQARRIAEQAAGPSYAAVLSQMARPTSLSPRSSPRQRVTLDPDHKYTKATQNTKKDSLESQSFQSNDHLERLKQQAIDDGKRHLVASLVVASQQSVPSQGAPSGDESEDNHQPMEEEAGTNTIPRPQRERENNSTSNVPKKTPFIRKQIDRSGLMAAIRPSSNHGGGPKKTPTPKEAATWKN